MVKQLLLPFDTIDVLKTMAEEEKQEVCLVLKELLIAYLQNKNTKGKGKYGK